MAIRMGAGGATVPAAKPLRMAAPQDCEYLWLDASDGYRVFARWWPGSRPAGAALYLHGIQSHGGWFEQSASRLAAEGLAVLLPDRRGSGRNEHDRGHTPSARRLVQDAVGQIEEIHRRVGVEQVHLLGVSWGGKLALAVFEAAAHRVRSLSLVTPGLFPRVDLSLADKLRIAWAAMTNPYKTFEIPLNEPELFTANPERIGFIAEDPLRLRRATAAFFVASRRLDRAARRVARRAPAVPLRVFLAEHDAIIDNERTRRFIRDLDWPDRSITEYRGAHHTLEFEPDNATFLHDLGGWLGSWK